MRYRIVSGSPRLAARASSQISAMLEWSVVWTDARGAVATARWVRLKLGRRRTWHSGCASFVPMMQFADPRKLDHGSQFWRLNGALFRSVLGQ